MNEIPILVLDNFFLFPKCEKVFPLENDSYWKRTIGQAWNAYQGKLIIIPSKEKFTQHLEKKTLLLGTLVEINLNLAPGTNLEPFLASLEKVQLRGLERVKIDNVEKKNEILFGRYQSLLESGEANDELIKKFVHYLPSIVEKTKLSSVENLHLTMIRGNIGNLIDSIAQNSREIDPLTKWRVLETLALNERLDILINLPDRQKIKKEIEDATRERIRNQNEYYYLLEQEKIIKEKLERSGGRGSRMHQNLERLEKEPYPNYVKKVALEEIRRYNRLPSGHSEASIIDQYIDWLVNLPWWQRTSRNENLDFARQKLDENHYGLEKVKNWIVQFLVAQKWAGKELGKVLLLVGEPGIGKTSLAKSIAAAAGRKFARTTLNGIDDASEIQGHRRTYMGSMPGRIIQGMKEAGVVNPLFLIDEIDKVGSSIKGDPLKALLTAFDPEQNEKFIDNYLGQEVPYNLSEVMFVCTANSLSERFLSRPLLERMEIVRLPGYLEEEKLTIAKKFLLPKKSALYNLEIRLVTEDHTEKKGQEILAESQTEKKAKIIFTEQVIRDIIRKYTREVGIRALESKIENIIKKSIVELEKKEKEEVWITSDNLKSYLEGEKEVEFTRKQDRSQVGVVNGLAWISEGIGDILPIEVVYYPKLKKDSETLEITGNLGKVMKESISIAWGYLRNYIKNNSQDFDIDTEIFAQNVIHVNALEGAIPKEGPSAGIALTSALLSALTGQPIPHDLGMTGEINLRGQVGKIGGLKEKAIAAYQSGLKTIIIPKANEKDIVDIPKEMREGSKGLQIIPVAEYPEVWEVICGKKRKRTAMPTRRLLRDKNDNKRTRIK